jgi:glutamyl-tRNA synthetase
MTVRTRFAPSPTGYLHIGGARTALFNALFARRHGGQYLLRIEDTDKARSTQEAVQQILDSLAWLGLSPDEPPVCNPPARPAMPRWRASCCPGPRLPRLRDSRGTGRDARARHGREAPAPLRGLLARPRARRRRGGKPFAIRLKAPAAGRDRGGRPGAGQRPRRRRRAGRHDHPALDGTPTYLHAVVVDDHDMAITHVIRGDDHLTNTFRQCMVYDAMGWHRPRFAHIPLIHGADGAKLSKRHGAVSVLDLREQGLLPEAVCNYLLRPRLGPRRRGDHPAERAEKIFDLKDVGRAASRMDYAKLGHLNGVYLRASSPDALLPGVLHRLTAMGHGYGTDHVARVRCCCPPCRNAPRP